MLRPSAIEVIDIQSTPMHLSVMESSIPVNVISGETLRREQKSTLGDTLEKLSGVHTNFHAKVASTPIIRGLSGPRVLISQNGLDVSDVSRVGPDHAVASEVSTATQIEVLRGPATLFYGSGAIGGVVNVVDNRVPKSNETIGEWLIETSSVDEQQLASFNFTTGADAFAFYADGYYRESEDYEVPVMAEQENQEHEHEDGHENEHSDKFYVDNSAEKSSGFTLGTSYLFDQGYVGLSVENFNKEYGIPGHSHGEDEHGHNEDHEDEHEDEHEHEEEHSEEVFADLEQTRLQMIGEFELDNSVLRAINFRSAYTDYEHSEIEEGEVGTVFANKTYEIRVDVLHQSFNDFRGGLTLHYKNSDVEALGAEAFTPPSTTEMLGLALIEERHFGDVLLQLGARVERGTLQADNVRLPFIDAHCHNEEESHDEDHDNEHDEHHGDEDSVALFAVDQQFTPTSLTAGAVWNFSPGYNIGMSVSRSQRAPSASELLSFGPHIGTRTYEVGAMFALSEEHEEHEQHDEDEHGDEHEEGAFVVNSGDVKLETAQNIDISLRKTEGDLGFIFNIFYNKVDDYYYQINTGLFAEDGHDHSEHEGEEHDDHSDDVHSDEHDHSGELPVFLFRTDDVILSGLEFQAAWQLNQSFKTTIFSDYVKARLADGGNLPRTPPMRFGTSLHYQTQNINAHIDVTRYQTQDRISDFETQTDGYTLVDASITFDLPINATDISIYLKGNNLTDAEARVHSSFLKDLAPRPGRNLSLGIKGNF